MINDFRFRTDLTRMSSDENRRKPRLFLLSVATLLVSTSVGWVLISDGEETASQASFAQTRSTDPRIEISLDLPSRKLTGNLSQNPHPGNRHLSIEPTAAATVQSPVSSEAIGADDTSASLEPMRIATLEIPEKSQLKTDAPSLPSARAATASNESTAMTPTDNLSLVAPDESVGGKDHWIEEKIKPGDSLSKIFSRLGLSASLLHRIVNSSKEAKQLANIRPGEIFKVHLDDENAFLGLIHQRSRIRSLEILPEGDGFESRSINRGLETRVTQASGTITNSLYQGAQRAGLSDELTMELANIFGWDIDFALEIRAGDHFSLIYEEEYLDGEKYGSGAILAAEFVNRGNIFRAVRYDDGEGNVSYYSPDGHSMRKAFLRAPVDFRRISSRFAKARWHPVLGKKRPHRGVDYAAATGTPIKASGDGRIIFRGRKGGYGNAVIIKHGSQYTTLYGHMSKFNRKAKQGSRVRQGQIIGYVGRTGVATGPHLHYEFRINGVHRNPLTIKLPAAAPIDKKYREDFTAKSASLLVRLDLISKTVLAEAQ